LDTLRKLLDFISNKSIVWFLIYVIILSLIIFIIRPDLTPIPNNFSITNIEKLESTKISNFAQLPQDGWKQIKLPDDHRGAENSSAESWYRISLDQLEFSNSKLMIYIPSVRQNLALYINDRWIGQGGRFEPYLARLWNHPLKFEFDKSLFRDKNNYIHIYLKALHPQSTYLSTVYLGPSESINPYWKWRYWLKVELLTAISYLLAVIGLINLSLWALRRQDSFYAWYGFAALVWAFRGYLLLTPELNISDSIWLALRTLTLGFGVVFVVLFNQRFFEYKSKSLDWLMFLYCIPFGLPLLFMDIEWIRIYGHNIWSRFEVLLGIYVIGFLLYLYRYKGEKKALMLLYTGIPLFLLGLRDLFVLTDRWDPHNGFLINYATPPALLLAMWFILKRFTKSLSEAEELNLTLENRVLEKQAEIEEHYQQQEKLKKEKVLSEERERIMRDMHDGIGGYLIGLKSLVESNKSERKSIKAHIDKILVDLRIVINSLDVTSQSVSTLLGSMRPRWQQIADNANIKLKWEVSASITTKLGPHTTLQIMRIVEEAFTNSIKHSGASLITVRTSHLDLDQSLRIEMLDNGDRQVNPDRGHGVKNMMHRARAIDAQIIFNTDHSGTQILLELPKIREN